MLSGARFSNSESSTKTMPAVVATMANAVEMPKAPITELVSVPNVSEPRPKPMNMMPEANPVRSGNHWVTVAMTTLYPSPVPQPISTP